MGKSHSVCSGHLAINLRATVSPACQIPIPLSLITALALLFEYIRQVETPPGKGTVSCRRSQVLPCLVQGWSCDIIRANESQSQALVGIARER